MGKNITPHWKFIINEIFWISKYKIYIVVSLMNLIQISFSAYIYIYICYHMIKSLVQKYSFMIK